MKKILSVSKEERLTNLILLSIKFKFLMSEEKKELKEYWGEMWDESFGRLNLKFYISRILFGLLFIICSIGYGGLLTLWFIAYPVILVLFIWSIFVWAVYFLLLNLGVIKWVSIADVRLLKNLKITH